MAGLDTRGLASGFAQGFGLMDSFYNRQERSQQRERGLEMREQAFEADMAQRQREQDQLLVKSGYARLAAGQELSEDQLAAFQRNPWMAPWHVATDEMGAAIEQAARVADPGDPADLNDPASIKAVNDMFGPRINRGHGKNKRIRAALPGPQPGTLVFELDVEDEGGNRYTAPMTRNRGKAGEDDEVLATDVGTMVEQAAGYQALRKVLSTPEARERALAYGRALGFLPEPEGRWITEKHPTLGMIQRNTANGEIKPISAGAGSPYDRDGSSNYWDRPTAMQKDIEYMVATGLAPDRETAWKMLRESSGDNSYSRSKDRIEAMRNRVESLEQIIMGEGAIFPSDEEIEAAREEIRFLRQEIREQENSTYNIPVPGGSEPGSTRRERQPSPAEEAPRRQAPAERKEPRQDGPVTADDILDKYL